MGGKKSALEIRHDKGEKLTDDEIKELIKEIYNSLEHPHPLLRLYEGGYRLYHNDKNWNCHFCDEEINAKIELTMQRMQVIENKVDKINTILEKVSD